MKAGGRMAGGGLRGGGGPALLSPGGTVGVMWDVKRELNNTNYSRMRAEIRINEEIPRTVNLYANEPSMAFEGLIRRELALERMITDSSKRLTAARNQRPYVDIVKVAKLNDLYTASVEALART